MCIYKIRYAWIIAEKGIRMLYLYNVHTWRLCMRQKGLCIKKIKKLKKKRKIKTNHRVLFFLRPLLLKLLVVSMHYLHLLTRCFGQFLSTKLHANINLMID